MATAARIDGAIPEVQDRAPRFARQPREALWLAALATLLGLAGGHLLTGLVGWLLQAERSLPLTGWLWLDPVVAIAVALNICREGALLVWRSAEGLMDHALEPEVRAQIEATLTEFSHNAIRFDHVTTRRAGQRRFVDMHMHMPSAWTLGRAAAVRGSVEQALMSAVPGLRATIQLLPMDVEAHFGDPKDPL